MPLSDLIIADPDEAPSVNAERGAHLKRWDCLPAKGIDTIKLGSLAQILTNRPPNDVKAVASYMTDALLHQASEDGPWVYLVPEPLQIALSALDEDSEEALAEKWAATEEFRLDGWNSMDVADFLHGLVALARRACESQKSLLLWMSL